MTIRTRKDTMDLKNLFEMQKADKYTQDGRDAVIKAQTEDRVYQPGEISQNTGMQKQPDGSWAPPKSTKYGKVTTNKEGKVGIQQTLGKGSKFEEFANEKAASRALANLTAGYNTTERSKEDPHSDKARQVKHWDKETEQIKKENKAERRAAHAAQFQNEAGAKQEAGIPKEATGTDRNKQLREEYFYSMKGTRAPVSKMAAEIERGTFDEEVINTMGGETSIEDLARDLISPAYEAYPDNENPQIPQEKLDQAKRVIQRRYKNLERESTSPAPQRKAQTTSSLKGYLENNFWSQPEDFEKDIKEAGWDVEEMNGEYAVVSNEAGSQYEVRFSPHGDGHDLTMESFTPLMIDEDDEDTDDSAPRQLTGDTRLHLSQVKDRVYKPGEISQATGLQKQSDGSWAPPKNGVPKGATSATRDPRLSKKIAPKDNYESFLKSLSPDQREAVEEIENDMQQVTENDIGHEAFDDLNTKYRMFMNSGDMGKLKEVAQILHRASGKAYKVGEAATTKNGTSTETKQETTPQNDYKVGETVTFKFKGKYYKGEVRSVGKNLIVFKRPDGELMGLKKESIEKVHIPERNKNKDTKPTQTTKVSQTDAFKDLKNKSGPEKRKLIHSAVKATNPKYAVKTWKNWKGEEQKQYCELKLKGTGDDEYYTDKETGNAFMMGKAEEAKINKNGNVEFSYTLQSTGTPMRVEFTQTKPEGVVKSEYHAPGPVGVPSSKQLLSHLV